MKQAIEAIVYETLRDAERKTSFSPGVCGQLNPRQSWVMDQIVERVSRLVADTLRDAASRADK